MLLRMKSLSGLLTPSKFNMEPETHSPEDDLIIEYCPSVGFHV